MNEQRYLLVAQIPNWGGESLITKSGTPHQTVM